MPREVLSIVCDDIRLEQGNKASLMGVYTAGIILPQLPFTMAKLCLFQELMDIENVKNLEVHLKGPKISFKAGLQIKDIGEKKTLNLRIGFGPLQFDEEGDYRFETYAENSSEPIVIKTFPVRVREDLKIK